MNRAERVLYAHITDVDSLDALVAEGFSSEASREVIPTEVGRMLVDWSIEYYFANGRRVAPTREAIMQTWGDELEPLDITIDDDIETDSVEWAIEQLRAEYAQRVTAEFVKSFAREVYDASNPDKVNAVLEGAGELYALAQQLVSRRHESLAGLGFDDVLRRHQERAEHGYTVMGLTFGLPPIDSHLFGIHPGEVCVFGAPTGVGKSWFAIKALLAEWRAGRRCMLVTLENDLEMTFDRMACMEARVDYESLQRGQLDEGSVLRVKKIATKISDSDHQPIVTMLVDGERDPASIVRSALSRGCVSVIIDQLEFVERVPGSKLREQPAIIAEIMKTLKLEVNGRDKISCLLLHQINRDGQERIEKTGKPRERDFAGSSGVEKTADQLIVLMQSDDMRASEQGELWLIKGRRVTKKKWQLWLRYGVGDIRVIREIRDDGEDED